jgi:hypothetical protein
LLQQPNQHRDGQAKPQKGRVVDQHGQLKPQ